MEEKTVPSAPVVEETEERVTFKRYITDTRNWDKLIILLAVVLAFCGYAILFRPSMAESIGTAFVKILQEPPAPPEPKPVITPGVVDMQIYNAPAKPEPKKK